MAEEVKVNPLEIDKHADRVEVRPVQDAKGPAKGGSHSFCYDCHRVIYNIWKYGPVSPARYNKNFCTCNGRWEGWDQEDIERNNYDALATYLEREMKEGRLKGVSEITNER